MRWTRGGLLLIEDRVRLSFDSETNESACFIFVVDIIMHINVGLLWVQLSQPFRYTGRIVSGNRPGGKGFTQTQTLVPLDQR
jgi:hypothetical protein